MLSVFITLLRVATWTLVLCWIAQQYFPGIDTLVLAIATLPFAYLLDIFVMYLYKLLCFRIPLYLGRMAYAASKRKIHARILALRRVKATIERQKLGGIWDEVRIRRTEHLAVLDKQILKLKDQEKCVDRQMAILNLKARQVRILKQLRSPEEVSLLTYWHQFKRFFGNQFGRRWGYLAVSNTLKKRLAKSPQEKIDATYNKLSKEMQYFQKNTKPRW